MTKKDYEHIADVILQTIKDRRAYSHEKKSLSQQRVYQEAVGDFAMVLSKELAKYFANENSLFKEKLFLNVSLGVVNSVIESK